ncbi:MAG: hypothetical protein HYX40_04085 [Sphingobacteriales bacterium]|nr:hypothetical protein [Sphingobacteriales bacterium]
MIVLMLSWSLYFFLHSWLASLKIKKGILTKFSSISSRVYRAGYNIISFAGLILLFWFQIKAHSLKFFDHSVIAEITGTLLMLAGIVIMVTAGLNYDLKSFFGFSEEKADSFKKNKLNHFVRHPLYSGTTMVFLGICIIWPYYKNIYLFIIYIIYLAIGIYLEEKKLVQIYGREYLEYQAKVKKIIPGIW